MLYGGVRVTSHVRSYQPGKATTLTEHMPKSHQKYVGRIAFAADPAEDAGQIGPYCGATGRSDPGGQAPSGAGISILRRGSYAWRKSIRPSVWKRCSPTLPERSRLQLPEYGLDSEEPARPAALPPGDPPIQNTVNPREHPRLRRLLRSSPPEAELSGDPVSPIRGRTMLNQQTIEKLYAMRMRGMADALYFQQQEEPHDNAAQLRGTLCPAGGSPVELATESGAGTAAGRGRTAKVR